jgi:thioredoxin 1
MIEQRYGNTNDNDELHRQGKPIPEIREPDFEMQVLKSKQPVLVNFWADWSQPCRRLGPVLEEVAAGCEGRVKVVKVNADDHPYLGLCYGIQSIPALLYFINGEAWAQIVGTASKEAILATLDSVIAFQKQANATTAVTNKNI